MKDIERNPRSMAPKEVQCLLELMMFHDIENYHEVAKIVGKEREFQDLHDQAVAKYQEADKKKDQDYHRERYFKKLKSLMEGNI